MNIPDVNSHLCLARSYRENKDYNSAIEELKTALKFNSKNGYIHFELGRMYQRQKNYDLSLKELNQAVKLGLDNGMVYFELGKTLRELRDFVSAKEALKKAVEFGLDGDRLHLELGRVYRDEGKEAQAKKEFQTALMLNPQNGEAYAELAWVYINAQEYALAEKELKEAIQGGFNKDDAYQILNKIKHDQQVVEKFEKTMDAEFKSVNHVGCITEYIFQVGYKEFVAKLKKITETNPMNLRAHIELAWIYSWHNHDDLAIKELKKISEITSLNKGFLTELTRIYLDKKKYDLAIEEFKKTMQNNFDNSNQDDNLNEEFIVTLKDLFSDREEEIENLIKDLPKIDTLYNWRYPAITKTEGSILYLITRLLKPAIIVEAGMWMGTSTAYLARGCHDNKKGKVITVDKQTDVGYAIADDLLPYVEFHKKADIEDALPKICNKETKIDMFFHDSENSYEILHWEIGQILPFIRKDGLIVAHDVLNFSDSPGMNVARFFDEIKDSAKSYFFSTEKGIGVIKDFGRLKVSGRERS